MLTLEGKKPRPRVLFPVQPTATESESAPAAATFTVPVMPDDACAAQWYAQAPFCVYTNACDSPLFANERLIVGPPPPPPPPYVGEVLFEQPTSHAPRAAIAATTSNTTDNLRTDMIPSGA